MDCYNEKETACVIGYALLTVDVLFGYLKKGSGSL